jgi:hypothetical protein
LQPWRSLSEIEQHRLRAALDDWLATHPRAEAAYRVSRGREEGYVLRFRLVTNDATYSVSINPDVVPPGIEWSPPDQVFWQLVNALQPGQWGGL